MCGLALFLSHVRHVVPRTSWSTSGRCAWPRTRPVGLTVGEKPPPPQPPHPQLSSRIWRGNPSTWDLGQWGPVLARCPPQCPAGPGQHRTLMDRWHQPPPTPQTKGPVNRVFLGTEPTALGTRPWAGRGSRSGCCWLVSEMGFFCVPGSSGLWGWSGHLSYQRTRTGLLSLCPLSLYQRDRGSGQWGGARRAVVGVSLSSSTQGAAVCLPKALRPGCPGCWEWGLRARDWGCSRAAPPPAVMRSQESRRGGPRPGLEWGGRGSRRVLRVWVSRQCGRSGPGGRLSPWRHGGGSGLSTSQALCGPRLWAPREGR